MNPSTRLSFPFLSLASSPKIPRPLLLLCVCFLWPSPVLSLPSSSSSSAPARASRHAQKPLFLSLPLSPSSSNLFLFSDVSLPLLSSQQKAFSPLFSPRRRRPFSFSPTSSCSTPLSSELSIGPFSLLSPSSSYAFLSESLSLPENYLFPLHSKKSFFSFSSSSSSRHRPPSSLLLSHRNTNSDKLVTPSLLAIDPHKLLLPSSLSDVSLATFTSILQHKSKISFFLPLRRDGHSSSPLFSSFSSPSPFFFRISQALSPHASPVSSALHGRRQRSHTSHADDKAEGFSSSRGRSGGGDKKKKKDSRASLYREDEEEEEGEKASSARNRRCDRRKDGDFSEWSEEEFLERSKCLLNERLQRVRTRLSQFQPHAISTAFLSKIFVSLPSSHSSTLSSSSSSSSAPSSPGFSSRHKIPLQSSSSSPSSATRSEDRSSSFSSPSGSTVSLHSLVSYQQVSPSMLLLKPLHESTTSYLASIEKALEKHASLYGYSSRTQKSPNSQNSIEIALTFPPLTEERRLELVSEAKAAAEEGRVAVRHARRDLVEELRAVKKSDRGLKEDLFKKLQERVQELTEKMISEIHLSISAKEKQLMKI